MRAIYSGTLLLFLQANPQLQLAGVILSSPFYRFPADVKINWVKRSAVAFLARNMPELVMGAKISIHSLARRKDTLESYLYDDYLTPFLCLRVAETLMDISFSLKDLSKINVQCPVLVFGSHKDKVTEFRYIIQLFEKIVSSEKKIHTFPEGLHQAYEDVESEEFMGVLSDWLKYKLKTYKMTQKSRLLTNIR